MCPGKIREIDVWPSGATVTVPFKLSPHSIPRVLVALLLQSALQDLINQFSVEHFERACQFKTVLPQFELPF